MEWIATTWRTIWLRRNKFIFENQFYFPRNLIQMSSEGMEDFEFAQMALKERYNDGVRSNSNRSQKKPDFNVVKANWDAILDTKSKRMDWG